MIRFVTYTSDQQLSAAKALANTLGLTCANLNDAGNDLVLNLTPAYLEMRDLECNVAIHVDFIEGALAHRRLYGGGKNQPLARAIGMKPGVTPRVIDATAGMAKDAFVLATLGCPLRMIERSPFVAALITDAITRASPDENFSPLLSSGFELMNANAIEYLPTLSAAEKPDVIYLDPMYPEKQKSALVKKNMQILQKLLGQDDDSEQLLKTARHCASKRVVVKRPKGAEWIANLKPAFEITSKNTRYDVYLPDAGD